MAAVRCMLLSVALLLSLLLSTAVAQSGDSLVAGIVPRPPFYNLTFASAPNTLIGSAPNWLWNVSDGNDNATMAAVHQGVAILTGASNSWIDLTTATGAQSAGAAIGRWGGNGAYGTGSAQNGWSIEIVFKPDVNVAQGWAKIIELSDGTGGGSGNNLALTWDNNDAGNDSGYKLAIEQYCSNTAQPAFAHGIVEMLRLTVNSWYHVVIEFQPVGSLGGANWFVFVNGQSLNYASALSPNATLCPINGGNMPLNVPRPLSTLGKSAWSADPYAQVTIDAFRVYDYLLLPSTVSQLAAAYQLNIPQAPQVSYSFPQNAETTAVIAAIGSVSAPPIFNAPFAFNPTSAPTVGPAPLNYNWLQYDPLDTPAMQQVHQGIVSLTGGGSSFINLQTIYGPNSVGMVLPIFGLPGSGTGSTQGLSVEVTVKFPQLPTNTFRGKIWDFGQGASTDSFDLSFDSNGAAFCIENQNNWNNGATYALQDFFAPPLPQTWYHLVWVLSNVNWVNYTATWTTYINGKQSTAAPTVGPFPLPIYRQFSWLGGSDWSDANIVAMYDALRIYDYVLSPAQIAALYATYTPPPVSSSTGAAGPCRNTVAANGPDVQALSIPPRAAVYNLNFTQAPDCAIGTSPSWTWAVQDPYDSASVAAYHQGVAILTGAATSWIDLTTASGTQSAGAAMPQWGGNGFYGPGSAMNGWSIEIVFKPDVNIAQGWSKILELSDGPGGGAGNNLALTWDNNDAGNDSGYKLAIEQYCNTTAQPAFAHGIVEVLRLSLNSWYHMVIQFQPNGTTGGANWFVYVNGNNLAFSSALAPSTTLCPVNGGNMPLSVPRPVSTLGRSAWVADPYAQVTIDALRVYDYILSSSTVQALAAVYNLNVSATRPQSFAFPSTPESTAAVGLVPTPPIFNAVFGQNPSQYVSGIPAVTNYVWMQSDPKDTTANQQLHQGLIYINGSAASYIDLTTTSGPQSVGMVLPIFGLPGSGSGPTQGLSVETVVKFPQLPTNTFRGKIWDFGQGASTDSFDLSFDNNGAAFCIENQNNWPNSNTYKLQDFFLSPQANTWYHIVWVLSQPNFINYTATWTAYVNGLPAPGVTPAQAFFPLPIYRQFSWLGGSDWSDANIAAMYDAVRIYDYVLSPAQIAALATLYLGGSSSTAPAPPVGVTSSSSSTASPTAPSYVTSASSSPVFVTSSTSVAAGGGGGGGGGGGSSSLSGGAIAGIVIGGVVGIALLCCLIVFICLGGGRRSTKGKPASGEEAAGSAEGRYNEVEQSTTQGAAAGETHTSDVELA